MGAPKQKWTCEEEAALKAGVVKHGSGKWQTILKDPEFSTVLYLRSNVDLKDKWRNMSVMSSGFGVRDRSKVKRVPVLTAIPKQEETTTTKSTSGSDGTQSDEDMVDAKPLAVCSPVALTPPVEEIATAPKRSIVRLENLILEAITNLKEPGGSIETAIASYIEEQYWAPPDFERVLAAKLKFLISSGKLIKNKHSYRIVPFPVLPDKRRSHPMVTQEGRQLTFPKLVRDHDLSKLKSQIDLELSKIRNMTPQDAAAAAARAIAEAETAIAEAEEAAREADEADAAAEAAKAFAEVASRMRGRNIPKMVRPTC